MCRRPASPRVRRGRGWRGARGAGGAAQPPGGRHSVRPGHRGGRGCLFGGDAAVSRSARPAAPRPLPPGDLGGARAAGPDHRVRRGSRDGDRRAAGLRRIVGWLSARPSPPPAPPATPPPRPAPPPPPAAPARLLAGLPPLPVAPSSLVFRLPERQAYLVEREEAGRVQRLYVEPSGAPTGGGNWGGG